MVCAFFKRSITTAFLPVIIYVSMALHQIHYVTMRRPFCGEFDSCPWTLVVIHLERVGGVL